MVQFTDELLLLQLKQVKYWRVDVVCVYIYSILTFYIKNYDIPCILKILSWNVSISCLIESVLFV